MMLVIICIYTTTTFLGPGKRNKESINVPSRVFILKNCQNKILVVISKKESRGGNGDHILSDKSTLFFQSDILLSSDIE